MLIPALTLLAGNLPDPHAKPPSGLQSRRPSTSLQTAPALGTRSLESVRHERRNGSWEIR